MTPEYNSFLLTQSFLYRRTESSKVPTKNVGQVVEALSGLDLVGFPKSGGEVTLLRQSLRNATRVNPLTIYVGSCPDYENDGKVYTYGGINGGLPLLTQRHLECDIPMLKTLEGFEIPYRFVIMVADVEATDEVFCKKFTDGDEEKFLRLCDSSVVVTAECLSHIVCSRQLNGELVSSSFFREFGRENFLRLQRDYEELLSLRVSEDRRFAYRVDTDTSARFDMYKGMYGDYLSGMNAVDRDSFLTGRTIRTMAQYLTLGRLISEKSSNPALICHPTRNFGVFNDGNKFPLPGDGKRVQNPIPIFEMKKAVY